MIFGCHLYGTVPRLRSAVVLSWVAGLEHLGWQASNILGGRPRTSVTCWDPTCTTVCSAVTNEQLPLCNTQPRSSVPRAGCVPGTQTANTHTAHTRFSGQSSCVWASQQHSSSLRELFLKPPISHPQAGFRGLGSLLLSWQPQPRC